MLTLDDLYDLEHLGNDAVWFKVFKRDDTLPDNIRTTCREEAETIDYRTTSFAMGYWRDRKWLYSVFEQSAPLTHEALMQASDLYLVLSKNFMSEGRWSNPAWYIESGCRLIQLNMETGVPTCKGIKKGALAHGGYLHAKPILGHDLALAFASHIGGMKIPYQLPMGLAPSRLPSDIFEWQMLYYPILSEKYGINTNFDRHFKKAKATVDAIFRRVGYSGELSEGTLRVFFDTGVPQDQTRDYVLIQTPKDRRKIIRNDDGEPLIYFVRNSDWQKIYVLNNPSVAIDHYVSHMLRNKANTFDFGTYLGEWK